MLYRFRPIRNVNENKDEARFFIRFSNGNQILNPTKELDLLQEEFHLPSCTSSNARHVLETAKGNSELDADTRAGN